jgi:hypothetical protein
LGTSQFHHLPEEDTKWGKCSRVSFARYKKEKRDKNFKRAKKKFEAFVWGKKTIQSLFCPIDLLLERVMIVFTSDMSSLVSMILIDLFLNNIIGVWASPITLFYGSIST